MTTKNKTKWLALFIILSILAGTATCVVLIMKKTYPQSPSNVTETDSTKSEDHFYIGHAIGESVIEFDKGNEVFLDTSLLAYLERMEVGTPNVDENGNYYFDADGDIVYDQSEEKCLEGVLDNLISLINHFAKEGYSMEANSQIQRFYVYYYDRLEKFGYGDLVNKLRVCFPSSGANAETLGDTVLSSFGIESSDGCFFVFRPMEVAEIKVNFGDVKPSNVSLPNELKCLNIYDNWRNEYDNFAERNLEGWLNNVILVASENHLDDDRIMIAEILFAGSLLNTEYRSDWKELLVRCLSVTPWDYKAFNAEVYKEFGVSIDNNRSITNYFNNVSVGVR